MPIVKLARFVNCGKRIEVDTADTSKTSYVAISHVWGTPRWRHIKCLEGEILISDRKAQFIEKRLYRIIGKHWFWLDIITVNQRDQAEVIATTRVIPQLFGEAEKTIAVREGDGIYGCCAHAIKGSKNKSELQKLYAEHARAQHRGRFSLNESFLMRLWTLQEICFSHTVQFVTCSKDHVRIRKNEESYDPLQHAVATVRLSDTLFCLAAAFSPVEANHPAFDQMTFSFVKAYVIGGTVSRGPKPSRTHDEDIFSKGFVSFYSSSERAASMPRDYIFATMPQFPWYHYPANAEQMSFNEIFHNFRLQASKAGHGFTGRFTESMTGTSRRLTSKDAWASSYSLPEPQCLGDFLKLLGSPTGSSLDYPHYASSVRVRNPNYSVTGFPDSVLKVIEGAMKFSPMIWELSFRGNELSKHGAWPENEVALHSKKIRREEALADAQFHTVAALDTLILEEEWQRSTDEWLSQQSMKILTLMFGSLTQFAKSSLMQGEWKAFARSMRGKWSSEVQKEMMLVAAMVSCQVALSALNWTRQRFKPVIIDLQSGHSCIGLLSLFCEEHKTLIAEADETRVILAGRHLRRNRGRDIAMVSRRSKMPIGLVPDFAHTGISSVNEFATRLSWLYGDLVTHDSDCSTSYIDLVPL